jgi:fatty-acid desaturase
MLAPKQLTRPPTVRGWLLEYAIPIALLHALSLLIFVPWLFSWTGLILGLVGIHFYGCLGINICYHRMLTHRSVRAPKWFERVLVFIALCCLQDTPVKWVSNHRMHHLHSDDDPDPHSPLVSFAWGHFDWLLKYNTATRNIGTYQKYARDILEDPFYFYLERNHVATLIYLLHTLVYFLVGFGIAFAQTGSGMAGLQFGLSLWVWGAIARTVAVWHITWSVNSLTHLFGYRNHETSDNSRNNWLVAIVATGEGWHNNHHHDQAACSNQHKWWEFDITYYHVVALKWLGLMSHIVPPAHQRRGNRPSSPQSAENCVPAAAASGAESPL